MEGRLRTRYAGLTPSQRIVADRLLSNPEHAAMNSVQRLAGLCGVSAATIVRFAVALGYSGFSELQGKLRANMVEALVPSDRLVEHDATENPYLASLERDRRNMEDLARSTQVEDLRRAVEMLRGAQRVFVRGGRTSSSVAAFLGLLLTQLRPNVITLENAEIFSDTVSDVRSGDVLVAVHLPRYASTTCRVGEFFAARGASLILIADSVKAPLAALSDVLLSVPYESVSFFNSNVAAMAIANALVAGLANAQPYEVKARLEAAEEIFEHFEMHVLSTRKGERHRAGDS